MTNLRHFLFIACFIISNLVAGQDKHYILALSKTERKLFVLDYTSLTPLAKIDIGEDPHEIVTNTNGTQAYISHPLMNRNGHEISVVNLKTLALEKSIDTKPFFIPHGLAYANNQLWFTAQGSKIVGRYNINTEKVEEVFGTGQDFTHLIFLTADQKRFYTTNVESGTVSFYEQMQLPPYLPPTGVLPPNAKPRIEWRQLLINVGSGAEGFDVSPDGKELWTARPDGHIIVVDLEKKKIKNDIPTKIQGLHRLKITPDGKNVIIVSVKTGDLLFYNYQTKHLDYQTKIGHGAGLYIDKDSNRLFVSCTSDNYIAVVDLITRKEMRRIAIGRPDGLTSVTVQ